MLAAVTAPVASLANLTKLVDPALLLAISILLTTAMARISGKMSKAVGTFFIRSLGQLSIGRPRFFRRRKREPDEAPALLPDDVKESECSSPEATEHATPLACEAADQATPTSADMADALDASGSAVPVESAPAEEVSSPSSSSAAAADSQAAKTAELEPKAAPEDPFTQQANIPLPTPTPDPVLNDRLSILQPGRPSMPQEPSSFTLFPCLPAELRLKIWFAALEHRRFIRIYTTNNSPAALGPLDNENAEQQLKVLNKQRYSVHRGVRDGLESRRFPTALLMVSSEARCAAREFYRVRLPAANDPGTEADGTWSPVLYLNPEWDHLRLFSKRPTGVLEFLHDVKRHDPRGVGVLNLVIGRGTLKDLTKDGCAALKAWDHPAAQQEIPQLLRNLRSVYFSHRDRDKYRFWIRSPLPRRNPLQPIFARPTEFHLLGPDPRPGLTQALKELWTCDAPRSVACDWKTLTEHYGLDAEDSGSAEDGTLVRREQPRTEHKHMICLRPEWKRLHGPPTSSEWVHDREDLDDLLRVDAERTERWDLSREPDLDDGRDGAAGSGGSDDDGAPDLEASSTHGKDRADEDERASEEEDSAVQGPERVAGFWLLPSEAFETCLDHKAGMHKWDVSAYTPELGVFRLPEKAAVRW